MSASSFFANQIFTRSPDTRRLAKELQVLISDAWVERIDAYADAEFYRAHLARLKLDDEAELLKGTRRELRNPYATARRRCLARNCAGERRGVPWPVSRRPSRFHDYEPRMAEGLSRGWNAVPHRNDFPLEPHSAVRQAGGAVPERGAKFDFWPNNLEFSGQYLISQAGPIFLATGVALATWPSAFGRAKATVDKPQAASRT